MLGTDTLKHSAAKVVEDPFTGKPVCLIPALFMDVGLIHVHRADKYGNCQIEGISGFSIEMSRACKRLIVSAEEIVPTEETRRYPDRKGLVVTGVRGGQVFEEAKPRIVSGDVILEVAGHPITPALVEGTCEVIASIRTSDEGQEGLGAFLAKRPPACGKTVMSAPARRARVPKTISCAMPAVETVIRLGLTRS